MDVSVEPTRKRKLWDGFSGGMIKKRWVTPLNESLLYHHTCITPTPTPTRKRRLFTAVIDKKTMASVVSKRSRSEYCNSGTMTKVPMVVNIYLNEATSIHDATGTSQMFIPVLEPKAAQAQQSSNMHSTAIIKHTPREQFWLSCIAAAVQSNAKEAWIVMPASEGGQIFQLSLESDSTSSGLNVEVSEILSADQHISEAALEPEIADMLVEELD